MSKFVCILLLALRVAATEEGVWSKGWGKGSQEWPVPTSDCTTTSAKPVESKKTTTCTTTTAPPPPSHTYYSTPCTTSTTSTLTCSGVCDLDAFGTLLIYPTFVSIVPVPATTLYLDVTVYTNGTTVTSTSTDIPPPKPSSTITWAYQGVTLTWPTTYVAYTDFSRDFVIADQTADICSTTSSDLTLGPVTTWSSLIYPASDIGPDSSPPTALVDYVKGLPAVQAELGSFSSACDPNSGIPPATAQSPLVTTISASTVDGNVGYVSRTTTKSVSAAAVVTSPPPPTTTPPAPPISTPSPTPTSSAPVIQTTNAAANLVGMNLMDVSGWVEGVAIFMAYWL